MQPVIEARDIRRVYPGGTVANDGVNLRVMPGEVHAVVGENGAGKSTLMKILFGTEKPDGGTLSIYGKSVQFANPREAIDMGIGMVFQHFALVPSFTVYENVVLGSEPTAGIRFDRETAIARLRELSDRFRLHVDPLARVDTLPVGQQQRVEILKSLYRDAKILILDEPTAVLAPQEVEELFTAVRALVAQGRTVIFIAHKLPEVLAISDSITVMRAGKTVAQVMAKDVTEKSLATLMVGKDVALRVDRAKNIGDVVARVEGLRLVRENGVTICDGLSLDVKSGEIVGLVGVEGNGQAELLEAIMGLRPVAGGTITLNAENIAELPVLSRRDRGVASIPEDRIATGVSVNSSIAENLVATSLFDSRFIRRSVLDLKAIRQNAFDKIKHFAIRAGGPDFNVGTLSGGNMQKVVVARELAQDPKLLLVNQPTRGVDLGATQFIWESITGARDNGAAVLLTSADLQELMALADRLVVFYRGKIVAALQNTDEVTAEQLGAYMLGLEKQTETELQAGLQ